MVVKAFETITLARVDDGSDGAPGKPGIDGKTPYFHQAWADSKDGKVNFSTTDPTNRGYLGTYSDFTQADSNDPSKYFWVELVGAFDVGGINLIVRHDELKDTMISPSGEAAPYGGSSLTKVIVSVKPGNALTMTRYNSAEDNNFRFAFYDASGAVVKHSYNADLSHTEEVPPKSATFRISYGTNLTVKLERGRKSSEYTLAPEDAQEQIDSVNNGLGRVEGLYNSILTPIASVTAPTNPKTGQQWWVLDANGKTLGLKIWNGSVWKDATIQQSAMNIGTLNGNIINGATINTSDFNMSFDQTNAIGGVNKKGTTTIENGEIKTDFQIKNTTQTGYVHLTPQGLSTGSTKPNGTEQNSVSLAFGQIDLSTTVTTPSGGTKLVKGSLNAEDMEKSLTTYWESGPAGVRQKFWAYKQFRRVVLTGVIWLPAADFGTGGSGYRTIFNITDTSIRPLTVRWVKCSSFGDIPHLGLLEFRPNGDVVAIGVPSQGRYSFEGESYAIENL